VALEFKTIEAAAYRLARSKIMRRLVLSSWDALLDYCDAAMSRGETEKFRVLFLDTKMYLSLMRSKPKAP
jgi:DNA repair protein RadC